MTSDKCILDATAGYRMMWFNKQHPNAIYLDNRPECEPDIVGDFRDLKQFADESFHLIVFDPPHIIAKHELLDMNFKRQFGLLRAETWQADIQRGAKELWRCLKLYGVLLFKWSNQQLASHELIALFPTKPLFYQISMNKKNRYNEGKRIREVQTLWFCFMKLPEQEVTR